MVTGEQRTPHPGQVHLGVSRQEMAQRGAELAVAEDAFSTVVRCRYQCSAATALSGADTSRFVKMNR